MCQSKYIKDCCLNLLAVVFFLSISGGAVWGKASDSVRPIQLLALVLHSVEGHRLKPFDIDMVLFRPGKVERLYLVTKSEGIYSFTAVESRATMQWQAKLVPSGSKNALAPTGPLGYYFERQHKRISNSATGSRYSKLGSFLNDLDDPIPVTAYKMLTDRRSKLKLIPLPALTLSKRKNSALPKFRFREAFVAAH